MKRCFQSNVWHRAALCSIVWTVMSYMMWVRYFGPALEVAFSQAQMQCESALVDGSFFRAICLQNAIEGYRAQHINMASNALFVATVPVIGLWALLVSAYLWCAPDMSPPSGLDLRQLPDPVWRARIEMMRDVRTDQMNRKRQAAAALSILNLYRMN